MNWDFFLIASAPGGVCGGGRGREYTVWIDLILVQRQVTIATKHDSSSLSAARGVPFRG